MSDAQELRENAGELERTDNNQVKKKFTPPILREYGEVVKICQAATTQGQNDYFTS